MYDISQQPEKMRSRYGELPEEIKELFEYGTVETVLDSAAVEFGLSDEQKSLLQMETELVLFLFLTRVGFVERVQESLEIELSRAELIGSRIESDLFVIVDNILTAVENELNNPSGQSTTVASNNPQPIVLPPLGSMDVLTENKGSASGPVNVPDEATENNLKPLRTFAMDVDMNRAHGYGAFRSEDADNEGSTPVHRSNQDDIIKK
jgi:hypothetical protein